MSSRWTLPPFTIGEIAPNFMASTRTNPTYHFNTAAGRYVLLAFMPADQARRGAALAAFQRISPQFDGHRLAAFFVTPSAPGEDTPADRIPGQRWLFDADGEVRRRYHLGEDQGAWFLLDPALRLITQAPLDAAEGLFDQILALPSVEDYAGVPLVAPVLIAPRVFTVDLCQRLIGYYDERGGLRSGVMRDIDGKTVGVLDPMKSRRDAIIEDESLQREVVGAISRNLTPMIRRALQFRATRLERYLVARYAADEGGYFKAHRDNETLGTAHRRFACSINLNDDFDGGDLRFPEFGRRTYRPPVGGAVVFCCSLQHEATPVTRGQRYAFLPFLHDEAAQKIRDQNRGFIDNSRPAVESVA
ncbi:2OG-Fe(II) oxygenase [Phenylobacterium kunshanense]|uniref:2OG-Fe(II) oxygenase n=1 Tax=Phenylobacterium kunshanense TaxID=1445034 RepID=A0A328BMD4_9CAUL|nr:2OG-Fe(II) oxygenase [Phenylobacterium kunshanense]RAK68540.1 2OG-Fe(II) oxygenase [Phenylobacterium kunshanense]